MSSRITFHKAVQKQIDYVTGDTTYLFCLRFLCEHKPFMQAWVLAKNSPPVHTSRVVYV